MNNVRVDYTTQRFTKANVAAHVDKKKQGYAKEFEAAEGRRIDPNNGTAQCTSDKGLAAYEAWRCCDDLYDDIGYWGKTGQWGI